MGTILASTIIDKAAVQLLDTGNTRWTRSELLGWLNDGQRQIVLLSPQTNNTVEVIQLAAGTRQEIPASGWKLLDVIRYMGTNGTTPGRAIRVVSQELLDATDPNWHNARKTDAPMNFVFDLQEQDVFYVYPPNTGRGYAQINYAKVPTGLTNESQAIELNDIYQTSLLDYILFRANSKDAEYAPGLQLAASYMQMFMSVFPSREKVDTENNPNQKLQPRNPATPGGES
jgi:hypothetical protein